MKWKTVFLILILSVIPSSIMLYIGISHNAMMEFCMNDPELDRACAIDIEYAVGIFFSWYLFSFLILIILFYLIRMVFIIKSGS